MDDNAKTGIFILVMLLVVFGGFIYVANFDYTRSRNECAFRLTVAKTRDDTLKVIDSHPYATERPCASYLVGK